MFCKLPADTDQFSVQEVLYPIMFCSRERHDAAADLFFSFLISTVDFDDLPVDTDVMVQVQV